MMMRTSYQREIDRFCQTLIGGHYSVREVTKGALSLARAKLNPWAFKRLNEVAVDSFYEGAMINVWHDMRLLAVDGSRLRLPRSADIANEYGVPGFGPEADSKTSLASCSLLYDVLNHVTIDAQIGPYEKSEKSLLDDHFSKIEKGDLLLADRYYPSYELMVRLQLQGTQFCLRMKKNWWLEVKEFSASDEYDKQVIFVLPKKIQASYGLETITCRLLKIELQDGTTEILCTSLLDVQKYEHDEFEMIYHKRWDVEEAYKMLKSRIELEAFSGKTARSVEQDFHAKILMMNLCATLSYPIEEKVRNEYAKEKTQNKHDQKVNRTEAIALTKDNLINLLIKNLHSETLGIMDFIIESTREIIRPFKKYERGKKRKKIHHVNYKPIT